MELMIFSIFILACLHEYYYAKKHALNIYNQKHIFAHLSNGFGQSILNTATMFYLLALYNHIFKNYSFFSPLKINILNTLIVILISDFIYYWVHRFSHRINLFIAIHNVHHQAQDYNLLSAFRIPWFNRFLLFAFFLPLAFLGLPFEMILIGLVINSLSATFSHSGLLKFKRMKILEFFLVTPRAHFVHHGVNSLYRDKNFGGIFIFWDRLFNTYQALENHTAVELPQGNEELHASVIKANTHYFHKIYLGIKNSDSLLEKFKIPFSTPEHLYSKLDLAPVSLPKTKQRLPNFFKTKILLSLIIVFFVEYVRRSTPTNSINEQATLLMACLFFIVILNSSFLEKD